MSLADCKDPSFLLEEIKAKRLDPVGLTKNQKKLCVGLFLESYPEVSLTNIGIALKMDRSTVGIYKKKVIKEKISQHIDPIEYCTELIMQYNSWIAKLNQERKWEKAARLKKDLTDQLMELGVLTRAAVPVDMNLTVRGKLTLQEIVKHAFGPNGRDESVSGRMGNGLAEQSNN